MLLLFLLQQLVLLEEQVILKIQTFFFITDDFSDKRCCIKNDRKRYVTASHVHWLIVCIPQIELQRSQSNAIAWYIIQGMTTMLMS